MAKRTPRRNRVYARTRGGHARYYADFRDFADVGGALEPLTPAGARYATADAREAEALCAGRLAQLERLRRSMPDAGSGASDLCRLGPYVERHLVAKLNAQKVGIQWMGSIEKHLDVAVRFFGARTPLRDIAVPQVQDYLTYLGRLPSSRRGEADGVEVLSESTRRKYLNSLSQLFKRAISEGILPLGHNPVSYLIDKPSNLSRLRRPEWLEVSEAALLLHAAREYRPEREGQAIPFAYEFLATLLLTGGRFSEIAGLEVNDVDLERGILVIWGTPTRRLKNRGSNRVVPLWPQLEDILRRYLTGERRPRGRLLFPMGPPADEQPVQDVRKLLDRLAERIGWKGAPLRTRIFRHTYCAARLQTLDRGEPVAPYTVQRELGHDSGDMVNLVYGHLGRMRHRSSVVEYRVEQWESVLGERVRHVEERCRNAEPRSGRGPKARITEETRAAVLEIAKREPAWGQDRVAAALRERGHSISQFSVRRIWRGHGLSEARFRKALVQPGGVS
jgi:integrase